MPSPPTARLIHATGAGIDRIAADAIPADAAVCNTGHHGAAIAEHVIMVAMMLVISIYYVRKTVKDEEI